MGQKISQAVDSRIRDMYARMAVAARDKAIELAGCDSIIGTVMQTKAQDIASFSEAWMIRAGAAAMRYRG